MDIARRLYTYGAAAVGLAVLGVGLTRLLSVFVIDVAGGRGPIIAGTVPGSDISLAIALVVTGLPIWLIHWRLAQRALRGDGPRARGDRISAIRAVYVAGVQVTAFALAAVTAISVVSGGLALLAGAETATLGQRGDAIATMVVAGAIWLAHARLRSRDLRRHALHGAAAWWPRTARYIGAAIALSAVIIGIGQVLLTIVEGIETWAALGDGVLRVASTWLATSLTAPVGMIVVGTVGWAVHWRDADALIRDREIVGEDERATRLRAAFMGTVLLGAAVGAGLVVAQTVHALLTAAGTALDAVEPIVTVCPLILAAVLLVRRQWREARALDERPGTAATASVDVRRRATLIVALPGLALLVGGATWLVTLLVETASGSAALVLSMPSTRAEGLVVAAPIALIVAGVTLWLPSWWLALRRRSRHRAAEATSTAWAVYLYAVLLASIVVLVPDAAILLYRVIDELIGGAAGELLPDQAGAVAILIVVGLVAASHGAMLRGDRRLAPASTIPQVALATVEPPAPRSITLVLHGPAAFDITAAVAHIRTTLGPDVAVEVATPATPTAQPG